MLCRCFREIERADYVLDVLTRCRHNGFPVVGGSSGSAEDDGGEFDRHGRGASRSGPLHGLILRSQILVMLRHQVCYFSSTIPAGISPPTTSSNGRRHAVQAGLLAWCSKYGHALHQSLLDHWSFV